jgi:carbonic anhydrase
VVGVRIEPASGTAVHAEGAKGQESAFFAQMLAGAAGPMPGLKEGREVQNVVLDPMLAIAEVGGGTEYWTYKGSLTTPPCSEGLRWFVMARPLVVGKEQLGGLRGVGKHSARLEQRVLEQGVNQ